MKGAPEKPMSGTLPASSLRMRRTESRTNGTSSSGLHTRRRVDRGAGADGLHDGARIEFDLAAHPLEGNHDVGEEDRGVHSQPVQRLERHLASQLGHVADVEEGVLGADRPVFLQIAAGLTHDPDRRRIHLFPAAGLQKTIASAHFDSPSAARSNRTGT